MSLEDLPRDLNGASQGETVYQILGKRVIAKDRVVAALVNRHLVGLNTPLYSEGSVSLVTVDDNAARPVLRQAAAHMFHHIMSSFFPELSIKVGQSLLGGHFYEVSARGEERVDLESVAARASQAFEELRLADLPFQLSTLSVQAAQSRLGAGSESKRGLLAGWPHPLVCLVSLEQTVDVQHCPYPPSTGFVPRAEVRAFPPGLVLQFSTEDDTTYGSGRKLLGSYLETRDWNRMVGVSTVGELNSKTLQDALAQVIRNSEAFYDKKIIEIADCIAERAGELRLVCLSGPSSSGKSTVVHRLSTHLKVNGLRPVLLSLDNYYRDRREMPRNEDGEQDYEAPDALDLELVREHLEALLAGAQVELPRFDFLTGRRVASGHQLKLDKDQSSILLIEGLHALNPLIWGSLLPLKAVFRIFVSALTQLVIDEHNRIQTSKVRLLRRIVRDRRYRGTPAQETLMRWSSVRKGEESHIFPFQEESEAIFNSSLVYEAAVLKIFAQRYLMEVPRDHPCQGEAYQLLKFLELFVPVFPDRIPSDSVLREFIGGGSFMY